MALFSLRYIAILHNGTRKSRATRLAQRKKLDNKEANKLRNFFTASIRIGLAAKFKRTFTLKAINFKKEHTQCFFRRSQGDGVKSIENRGC